MNNKLTPDQLVDILMQLNGQIKPIGETTVDDKRYENLICLMQILDDLIDQLIDISEMSEYKEYSRQRAGKESLYWLCEKRDTLVNHLAEIKINGGQE